MFSRQVGLCVMGIGGGWEVGQCGGRVRGGGGSRGRGRDRGRDRGRGRGRSRSRGSCGRGGCIRIARVVMLASWWWWRRGKLTNDQCIFMLIVLDPRLKLCYYEEHDWEKEYIDKAKETVARIYQSQYAPM